MPARTLKEAGTPNRVAAYRCTSSFGAEVRAGLEVAERMGLLPRLQEVRYPVAALRYVDRDGRQTSNLNLRGGFDQVVSVLRGDLARTILDEVRAPVCYGTSVEAVEHTGGSVTVRPTDGTHREVDLLVGADGAHSRVRELVFGAERRFVHYVGHHVAACVLADEDLSRQIGMRYQILTVPGLMAGARDWMVRLAALPGADRLLMRSLTPGSHTLITRRPGVSVTTKP